MVRQEPPVYLLIGKDIPPKSTFLKNIKARLIPGHIGHFNLDILYAKELSLRSLQERLLCLPVKAKKRIIVLKDAELLKDEIKDFINGYVRKPFPYIVLVLDFNTDDDEDDFISRIARFAQIPYFRRKERIDAFTLSRQIEFMKIESALLILKRLLENGQRPEMILGGLRYFFEKKAYNPSYARERIKLLVNCDRDIKTGKIKAEFALEKLIVSLCSLGKT